MQAINFKKIILYFALTGLILTLWDAWQSEHIKVKSVATDPSPAKLIASPLSQTDLEVPEDRIVHVKTNVLDLKIDTLGGDIIEVNLPAYKKTLKSTDDSPIQILSNNSEKFYISQSGFINKTGSQIPLQYSSARTNYVLDKNQEKLVVVLKGCAEDSLCVTKNYEFLPNQYAIQIKQVIHNTSSSPWVGQMYGQIQYRKPPKLGVSSSLGLNTYTGAAFYTPDKPYTKLSYQSMEEKNLDESVEGGWIALQQHYFLSAWVPDKQEKNRYFSRISSNGIYTIGFLGPVMEIKSGDEKITDAKFYVGPENTANLKILAKGLDLTIDYGWLWIISMGIFWVMQHIYQFVGNWGWSIILVTVLIKLIFFKLSEASYRSMAKMKKFQPRIAELKQRYGNDKQQLSKATIELYRKEKINPLGGCLPFIVQIPVFIALYYVLIESVELRHAPFVFWLQDLSSKDPYFILPVLMGISMLIQQKLNPPPADPVQAKVMMLLPVIFTLFFIAFPSGLVLYWIVNNCLSILQQWYITSRIEKA